MRIKIDPETFHRWLEAILRRGVSKNEAYWLWLSMGLEPGGGDLPRVPLGLISRLWEDVRVDFDSEEPAEVSKRLAEAGFPLDRRNVRGRIAKCSGFDPELVAYWADRSDEASRADGRQVIAYVSGSTIMPAKGPARTVPVSGEWRPPLGQS